MVMIKKIKAESPFNDNDRINVRIIQEMTNGSIISAFLENTGCWNVTEIVNSNGEPNETMDCFIINSADISVLNDFACLIANDKFKWNNGFRTIPKSTITKQWNKMAKELV